MVQCYTQANRMVQYYTHINRKVQARLYHARKYSRAKEHNVFLFEGISTVLSNKNAKQCDRIKALSDYVQWYGQAHTLQLWHYTQATVWCSTTHKQTVRYRLACTMRESTVERKNTMCFCLKVYQLCSQTRMQSSVIE